MRLDNKNENLDNPVSADLGTQLVVELYECDSAVLNDGSQVEEILLEAVKRSGATIVNHCFHKFSPHGVSGVVVISESHVAIHSWPEYGYCAVDVFTCGDQVDTSLMVELLKKGLKSKEVKAFQLERGFNNRSLNSISASPASCGE